MLSKYRHLRRFAPRGVYVTNFNMFYTEDKIKLRKLEYLNSLQINTRKTVDHVDLKYIGMKLRYYYSCLRRTNLIIRLTWSFFPSSVYFYLYRDM